jgi:hypothetical protein
MKKSIRNISKRKLYNAKQISETAGVNLRTVHRWFKLGLPVLDKSTHPYLVKGVALRDFLVNMREKKRFKLKGIEIYCVSCQCPRLSNTNNIKVVFTRRKMGKKNMQAIIYGVCKECGCKILRFSTEKIVSSLVKEKLISAECITVLIDFNDHT